MFGTAAERQEAARNNAETSKRMTPAERSGMTLSVRLDLPASTIQELRESCRAVRRVLDQIELGTERARENDAIALGGARRLLNDLNWRFRQYAKLRRNR